MPAPTTFASLPDARPVVAPWVGWLLGALLIALLQGCASAPAPAPEVPAADEPARMVVGPQERTDFDAAMQALKAEDHDRSIALLNKLAQALPKNPIPHINLAHVYRKQGKLDEAEQSLQAALKIAPEHPVANNEYALLYRKTGRFQEARKLYEDLLRKHPNFSVVHKNLGILCDLYLSDYGCALTHYTRYAEEHGTDKQLKIWIADVQRRAGK